MSTCEKFTFFYTGPFSQWHPSKFQVDGQNFTHAEQYMMAAKASLFSDQDALRRILKATHPKEQKALGRQVKNFNKESWNKVARDLVYCGNYAKFTQDQKLKGILLATDGTTLVEASRYDRVWGMGLSADDPKILSRKTWKGTNWLGEVLTKVREDIKAGVKSTEFNWS